MSYVVAKRARRHEEVALAHEEDDEPEAEAGPAAGPDAAPARGVELRDVAVRHALFATEARDLIFSACTPVF